MPRVLPTWARRGQHVENAARLRQAADDLEEATDRLSQDVSMPKNGSGKKLPKAIRRGTVCGRFRNDTRAPG